MVPPQNGHAAATGANACSGFMNSSRNQRVNVGIRFKASEHDVSLLIHQVGALPFFVVGPYSRINPNICRLFVLKGSCRLVLAPVGVRLIHFRFLN